MRSSYWGVILYLPGDRFDKGLATPILRQSLGESVGTGVFQRQRLLESQAVVASNWVSLASRICGSRNDFTAFALSTRP